MYFLLVKYKKIFEMQIGYFICPSIVFIVFINHWYSIIKRQTMNLYAKSCLLLLLLVDLVTGRVYTRGAFSNRGWHSTDIYSFTHFVTACSFSRENCTLHQYKLWNRIPWLVLFWYYLSKKCYRFRYNCTCSTFWGLWWRLVHKW